MLTALGITAAILVLAAAVVLMMAAAKPDTFRIQRTASIAAPPEKIFPLINDFDNWLAWSPFENKDPTMQRSRSGPAAGKGSIYAWEGNRNIGKGRMEILEATPHSKITFALDFERPFQCHNRVDFLLATKGATTDVTWAMEGPVPFVAKIMHVFLDMDRMCGKDFEIGLASMKAVVERQTLSARERSAA